MSLLHLDRIAAAPWGKPLLEDISLAINSGEIVCLAGPNGAGKSSLLKLIAGDIPLDRGEFYFNHSLNREIPRRELARQMAFLPQLSLLNFPYTVEEVIRLGRIPHATGNTIDDQVIAQTMSAMDIQTLAGRLYTQLSGGERQRVQLARVFAQIWGPGSPAERLLLLDEPTSALDLSHQQLLARAIGDLAARGCAVILVLHDLNLAASLADRLLVIKNGGLVADGTPSAVLTELLFRDVFDVDVVISQHPVQEQSVVVNYC